MAHDARGLLGVLRWPAEIQNYRSLLTSTTRTHARLTRKKGNRRSTLNAHHAAEAKPTSGQSASRTNHDTPATGVPTGKELNLPGKVEKSAFRSQQAVLGLADSCSLHTIAIEQRTTGRYASSSTIPQPEFWLEPTPAGRNGCRRSFSKVASSKSPPFLSAATCSRLGLRHKGR